MTATDPFRLYGWIFDGKQTHPPIATPPCPVCGSLDVWTEAIADGHGGVIPGYRHCRSCAGPQPKP